jgi:hypothetical protein
MNFEKYGYAISDNDGELRDISGIIADLEEVLANHSTHAMNSHVLFLQGQEDCLKQVIKYLKRV